MAAGYAPLVTGGPEDLARIIRTETPQLVLLDLVLPGSDGIELMKQVPELIRPAGHLHLGLPPRRHRRAGARGGRGRLHRQALLADRVGGAGAGGAQTARRAKPFVLGQIAIDYAQRQVTVGGEASSSPPPSTSCCACSRSTPDAS
ncbi:MAG: hypothetical protein OXG04_06165 [Acidobacteria bacterium]|nr:hypothetical protein [Acidobacteriota bacterium]